MATNKRVTVQDFVMARLGSVKLEVAVGDGDYVAFPAPKGSWNIHENAVTGDVAIFGPAQLILNDEARHIIETAASTQDFCSFRHTAIDGHGKAEAHVVTGYLTDYVTGHHGDGPSDFTMLLRRKPLRDSAEVRLHPYDLHSILHAVRGDHYGAILEELRFANQLVLLERSELGVVDFEHPAWRDFRYELVRRGMRPPGLIDSLAEMDEL